VGVGCLDNNRYIDLADVRPPKEDGHDALRSVEDVV